MSIENSNPIQSMPTPVNIAVELSPGDYYEDCAYHPCLCIHIHKKERMVDGVSLVNGVWRQCGVPHCGVRKLTLEEAITWRFFGPPDLSPESEAYMTEVQKYWSTESSKGGRWAQIWQRMRNKSKLAKRKISKPPAESRTRPQGRNSKAKGAKD